MVSFIDKCNHFVMLCFHDLTIVIVNTVQQWCQDCVDDTLECWGTVPLKIGLVGVSGGGASVWPTVVSR